MDDLLKNYGSSSDDDDEEANGNNNRTTTTTTQSSSCRISGTDKKSVIATATTSANVTNNNTNTRTTTGTTTNSNDNTTKTQQGDPDENHKPSSNISVSSSSLLRRKMLSLQAVLPTHIFSQLTGEDDDDDNDNDEENRHIPPKKTTENPSVHHSSQDPGVSRLLQALHSTAAATTTTTKVHYSKPAATTPVPTLEPASTMGAAFLSTTTTTQKSVKKKNDNHDDETMTVRDIHAEESTARNLPDKLEETMGPGNGDGPSLVIENIKPKAYVMKLTAAPKVAKPVQSTGGPQEVASVHDSMMDLEQLPVTDANDVAPTIQYNSSSQQEQQQQKSRYSRKEMERLLRQGQLNHEAIQDSDRLTEWEQEAPNQYVPEQEVTTNQIPLHGVRNVPTQMYDPSAGGTITGVRGRGKNQISHLLGQAANLELARARGMPGSSNNGMGNVHRVNAKRKYGW